MRIIADENIPYAERLFSHFGDVQKLPGRKLKPSDVVDADILLVRSVTQVNTALLEKSRVQFVGSATIGTDHIDLNYLSKRGIGFSNAPGCNALAASEYTLAAALALAERQDIDLAGKTAAIIGCGHVGTNVYKKLQALDMRCIINDPPRQATEKTAHFVTLDEALKADLITLHVPLTRSGPTPSWHLLDQAAIDQIKPGTIVINAARGGVIDNAALSKALLKKRLYVALDVWEHEPRINVRLLEQVDIGTPHIAGYSLEGRVRGTQMVYEAACRYFKQAPRINILNELKQPDQPTITIKIPHPTIQPLKDAVRYAYDIRVDDEKMRQAAGISTCFFDQLRRDYPLRREFSQYTITGDQLTSKTQKALALLGFNLNTGLSEKAKVKSQG